MRIAILRPSRSAVVAAALAIAGALTGSAHASVIASSPTFPPIPLSFASPTGAGCFDIAAVCVTPGIFTLTSAVSTFNIAGQDIDAGATYTGSLTTLPPGSAPLGPFTLSGTVDFELLGRTFSTETGSWATELTGMLLTGPLLGGTLTTTLDDSNPSIGTTSVTPLDPGAGNSRQFVITSFFDIFVDLTFDRPGLPALHTSAGPIEVAAVPESSTWAMLVIGFAALGSAAYRRRAAATA